jgi:AmiR/NasT family two-component response regulator
MAIAAPILCVVENDGEGGQLRNALAALNISNPVRCIVGATDAMAELDGAAQRREPAPVLVFLNLAAPEANRLAAWFEAHPEDRPSGLIAMTGFHDMRPIMEAYHLGVTSFLQWPLKTGDVCNALITNGALKLEPSEGAIEIRPAIGVKTTVNRL